MMWIEFCSFQKQNRSQNTGEYYLLREFLIRIFIQHIVILPKYGYGKYSYFDKGCPKKKA